MFSDWEIVPLHELEFKSPYPRTAYVNDAEYEVIMNDKSDLVEATFNLTEDQYYDLHGHYRGSSNPDCILCGPQ